MRSDEEHGLDTTARLIVTDDAASRAIEQAWLDAGYDYDDIDMDMLHLAAEAVSSSQEERAGEMAGFQSRQASYAGKHWHHHGGLMESGIFCCI